jgi:hypothetical protein
VVLAQAACHPASRVFVRDADDLLFAESALAYAAFLGAFSPGRHSVSLDQLSGITSTLLEKVGRTVHNSISCPIQHKPLSMHCVATATLADIWARQCFAISS